jgi:hypothetical protein
MRDVLTPALWACAGDIVSAVKVAPAKTSHAWRRTKVMVRWPPTADY